MIFRKEFAFLGVIFGCFIFASLAFPGGVVQSSVDGTANIPHVETFGDLYSAVVLFLFMALMMLGTVLIAGVVMTLIRLKNLEEVAIAYDVDVKDLKGMTPMQAAQMLNARNETHDLIAGNAANQSAIGKAVEQSRLSPDSNNHTFLRWLFQ